MEPTLGGYTPEQVQSLCAMYFRDMTNERVAKELQRVADLAAQRQRETDEAKRNGTYKPTNAQHQQQQ
jgi:hypothetical protein